MSSMTPAGHAPHRSVNKLFDFSALPGNSGAVPSTPVRGVVC